MIAPVWTLSRTLKSLLHGTLSIEAHEDREISGIQLDSRLVSSGDLFLALQGGQYDGLEFAQKAIEAGAVAVLHESPLDVLHDSASLVHLAHTQGVALLYVEGLSRHASQLAARFYGQPSNNMSVVGITGTDGKTSVSHFMAQALKELGKQPAMIGTLGNGLLRSDQLKAATHTTPNAVELQALLSDLRSQSATHVSMEVSSHALDQGRVDAVNFDFAILTNLARDHMDYHKSMVHYANAKRRLFTWPSLQAAIVNCDDDFGARLASEFSPKLPVYGYGFDHDMSPNLHGRLLANGLALESDGLRFNVQLINGFSRSQVYQVHSKLIGAFNAHNLLAVMATLIAMGVRLVEAVELVHQIEAVPGRMQVVLPQDDAHVSVSQPMVAVDYAHTPQALEAALRSLRSHLSDDGKLICVFGCGGNRDKGKRPLMGEIAERHADVVIITNDNPRNEDAEDIAADICAGIEHKGQAQIVLDRQQAIQQAIAQASDQDIVLIAGKGHETNQIVKDQSLPFSDFDEAQAALQSYQEVAND